jgi:FtsH-like protein
MTKETKWNLGYTLIALIGLPLVQAWYQATQVEIVPYREFEHALEAGRVERVVVTDRHVMGVLKAPDAQGKRFTTANLVEPNLAERLSRFKVPYTREYESSPLPDIVSWVAPALVFFGLWFFLFAKSLRSRALADSWPSARATPRYSWRNRPVLRSPMSPVSTSPNRNYRRSWSFSKSRSATAAWAHAFPKGYCRGSPR